MQLNADIAPIKSLHFESGSKHLEPGEKNSGLHGKFSIICWVYFTPFSQYSPRNCKHMPILWCSLTWCG